MGALGNPPRLCILLLAISVPISLQQQQGQFSSEAFFLNGTSYTVTGETIQLTPGSVFGFSFRTCTPGELLKQTGDSLDQLKLSIGPNGRLVLTLTHDDLRLQQVVGKGLLDGKWHTVQIAVGPLLDRLDLSVSVGQREISDIKNATTILRSLDLSSSSPQLRIGAGLVACIREGPGVRFTQPGLPINSVAVLWDECLLPYTCEGFNWPQIRDADNADCPADQCQNDGVCVVQGDQATCLCPAGLAGPNCLTPVGSCAEQPCRNGGVCVDDGAAGFRCRCEDTGYTGRYCHIVPTSGDNCATTCLNGGTCLPQPNNKDMCQCADGFVGDSCEESVKKMQQENRNSNNANPCLSADPYCQNEGDCLFQPNSGTAICVCPVDFTGARCETPIGCRNDNDCSANANCVDGKCQCIVGFSGPDCQVLDDPCLQITCQNGGSCVSNANNDPICSCLAGFTGSQCETTIDDCQSSPCQNGGICKNLPDAGQFECQCANGFKGTFCNEDIDECTINGESPCVRGTCQNYVGGYRCLCNPGWSGRNCDKNIDDCKPNPCLHSGKCIDQINGYRCQCTPGYTGLSCETDIDDCASAPCLNGGTCTDGLNNFTCSCPPSFMGEFCEVPYDPCTEDTCKNGGVCKRTKTERDPGNDFVCECPEGFDGVRCENNIDECLGVTCPGNKVCVDLVASYECQCPPGLTGENCSEQINECLSNPCENNATCTDLMNGFSCACTPGWRGPTCSDDIDECAENDNLCNNGICRNLAGSYQCYCRPGFSGNHCNHDFDECLSRPCLNGGNCTNLVNSYECSCPLGFKGLNCEINIDECESNPCLNGATCVDGINNYTCECVLGFTGRNCEVNIDECESNPCENGGRCEDGINEFTCDCSNTGFMGDRCEINIDECEPRPCQNNATCQDLINDFLCECFPGYEGKQCEIDIAECAESPCLNGALCFELSNQTLYQQTIQDSLPSDVRENFNKPFDYADADGYLCSCLPGYEGVNCEVDIDECAENPCLHGECIDGIAKYTCACYPGYEGTNCELEIDECEKYQPCQHGSCMDRIADYNCTCDSGWGGKNCSVELIGCQDVVCLNNGVCTPWLVGESDHRANCSCTSGFDGLRCQSRTTFSLNGRSFIKVPSSRDEGYELHMRFRTTLGNGLVAIGQGNTHFSLQLREGKLNLHSNLISKFEGIIIGDNLNNTEWQKVYVAVNTSHLTLGVNDQLQATQPINPTGLNDTVFFNTYLGGIVRDQEILANNVPSFTGCIQDITVNDMKITEEDFKPGNGRDIEQVETVPGCPREEQCNPNPCQNSGFCTDLWSEYKCTCHRPFLGQSCQYNYTAATFGYENTTTSLAVVDIANPLPFKSGIDVSMFIRTREQDGFIFYIGNDLADISENSKPSYITGELIQGDLVVNVVFEGKKEKFQVYTVDLSDGRRHFVRVVRMNNSMMVKVNETVSINHEIPSPKGFLAQKLFLGNFPTLSEIPTTTVSTTTTTISTTSSSTTTTAPATSQTSKQTITSTVVSETTVSTEDEDSFETTPFYYDYPDPTQTENRDYEDTTVNAESTDGNIAPSTDSLTSFADTTTPNVRVNSLNPSAAPQLALDEDLESVALSPEPNDDPELKRTKRQAQQLQSLERAASLSPLSTNPLGSRSPQHFKGIIQDVQISNGANFTRIVELFELDIEANKPPSIGEVQLIDVLEGEVSDDTCRTNPCLNGGTCQVTWNDFECQCPLGYKGRICDELEYCYWRTCPMDSQCQTLIDGHECVSNATFNGINSTVVFTPDFRRPANFSNPPKNFHFVTVTFRTKMNGTLLHIINEEKRVELKLAISRGKLDIALPDVNNGMRTFSYGTRVNNGKWHRVRLTLNQEGSISVTMDQKESLQLTPQLEFDLRDLVIGSNVVVGSSLSRVIQTTASSRDLYTTFEDSPDMLPPDIDIRAGGQEPQQGASYSLADFYRGCLGEIRIGGVLLPYFTEEELVNNTASQRFVVRNLVDVTDDCYVCYDHECQNGGSCSDPTDVFECQCPEGFEDPFCSTNIDECAGNNCVNGVCVDGVANYTCECNAGWTGWLCDEDFDECLAKPCLNGGTCQETATPGSYTCTCTPDYVGMNCEEVKVKTCAHAPCLNGGTCRPNPTGDKDLYLCDCLIGYKGFNCEIKKDFCIEHQQPCQNGATCISDDSTLNHKCICAPGYTGRNCEEDIDECASEPCLNGGKCTDLVDDYICDCSDTGFEGQTCERNINECERDDPCVFGMCQDLPGSYKCQCKENYCGTNCQRMDPCILAEQNMCQNGGTCQPSCDVEPYYMCLCTEEWTGLNCTTKNYTVSTFSHAFEDNPYALAYVVTPIVGGLAFIACLIGVLIFVSMAKRQRAMHGKYNPYKMEMHAARFELNDLKMKPPPEERLI